MTNNQLPYFVVGVDPAPDAAHCVLAHQDCGRLVVVDTKTVRRDDLPDVLSDWLRVARLLAVEDPTGILFSKTSTLLWSRTCQTSGIAYATGMARKVPSRLVRCSEARDWLATTCGATGRLQSDANVREALIAVAGDSAFVKAKACRGLKKKSHGLFCKICEGTGVERPAGKLSSLTTTHFRDAFVVAAFAVAEAAESKEAEA